MIPLYCVFSLLRRSEGCCYGNKCYKPTLGLKVSGTAGIRVSPILPGRLETFFFSGAPLAESQGSPNAPQNRT